MNRGGRLAASVLSALLGCGVLLLATSPVMTLPQHSARTKKDCGSCHFDPLGGGARNGFGFTYAKQRNDLEEDSNDRWADLPDVNQLGDYLYVGTDLRTLYLWSSLADQNTTDISTFFQMQGALYVVFQPDERITILMNRDYGEFSGDKVRDLYGMVKDESESLYLKAGRFRTAFGLRQEDHTAGTRSGFLQTTAGGTSGLLPFDPRNPMTGLELGYTTPTHVAAVQLTNGGAPFSNRAQTVSGQIAGYSPWGFAGLSGFDSYQTSSKRRYSRWGVHGGMPVPGLPAVVVFGEVGGGTDDLANGEKHNLLAGAAQLDYRVMRGFVLRGRYDYSDVHRSEPGNASERFQFDVVLVPVPFSEFTAGYRRVVPERTSDDDQVLLMWHFNY